MSSNPQPYPIKLGNLDLQSFWDRDVLNFRVTATVPVGPAAIYFNEKPVVHWRFVAVMRQVDDSAKQAVEAIFFHVEKPYVISPYLQVKVEFKNRLESRFGHLGEVVFDLRQGRRVTLGQVYNLVKDNEMNRFQHTGSGSGCFTWIRQLMVYITKKHWLFAAEVQKLQIFYEKTRNDHQDEYAFPPQDGAHFDVIFEEPK
ncbi:hypothetical protein D9756_008741 [Leucocoprinus leucothites]|uniref:DUF7770 domain-containing protein n=1 Tax=Leucocoprinus leucothites TaxID=201217 RepID=A0A8H5D0N5_9AGAR|nr:hypothetical protein D9756_008741 [Leucoagaricus leucothites]